MHPNRTSRRTVADAPCILAPKSGFAPYWGAKLDDLIHYDARAGAAAVQVLDSSLARHGTLAALSSGNPGIEPGTKNSQSTREDAHDSRRCSEINQRKRSEIR
jgi:hypothetical protein